MAVMALQLRHFPLSTSPSSSIEHNYDISRRFRYLPLPSHGTRPHLPVPSSRNRRSLACVGKEDTQLRQPSSTTDEQPEAQDLEYIRQIQRVLELLKKNRDMLFNEVNEGKFPKNRVALQMLAEEMTNWPNLEAEAPKKKRSKSLYAKATDTGVNPREAAKRLNIDWDTAAEIEDADLSDDPEVPAAVGYGALYIVTAFPVIIGISVVLILFYNSLQ
ncbi:ycf3-interacting protein 1, chloroplastic isoform X2 [Cucumis sativus]|uniref:ycf3-interacting protein 1, chloroplastic isoform X2 n=1 Tax=Cucumis sativus TaxID=3659 RepID=UPI0012F48B63|nr:ycf3-interacting protein 1, chloroplastic isoform X2 [Cucumis sativus]